MNGAKRLENTDPPIIRIVDSDFAFRSNMQSLLQASGYRVMAYGSVGEMLLAGIGCAPGCILLDLHMPGPSGLDLQEMLMAGERPLPIIFITDTATVQESVRAMKAGALDFLIKPIESDTLLSIVYTAVKKDASQRREHNHLSALKERYATLSPREREVLDMVVNGAMNKHISAAIGAAERTVKAHRAQAMAKLKVNSLAALMKVVIQLNSASHVVQRARNDG